MTRNKVLTVAVALGLLWAWATVATASLGELEFVDFPSEVAVTGEEVQLEGRLKFNEKEHEYAVNIRLWVTGHEGQIEPDFIAGPLYDGETVTITVYLEGVPGVATLHADDLRCPRGAWTMQLVEATPTSTPTPTSTSTNTPTPTSTYTPTPTGTPTPTSTYTPTPTNTYTPTPTSTSTPTATATPIRHYLYLPLVMKAHAVAIPFCNGDFETGDFSCWTPGGDPFPSVVDHLHNSDPPYSGEYCALLGESIFCEEHDFYRSWIYQDFTIPADAPSPTLSFAYRIFTNDILAWASFRVEIRDLHNVTIAEVLRDGYAPPDNIAICYNDLGWRSKDGYDLSKFKGRTIRLWFEIRNEHDGGLGIWTYVDDVVITP